MAGRTIEVDTSILKADVSEIEGEIRSINDGATQLENILRQLEGMWEGDAKMAFSNAVNDDLRRLRELSKAIGKFTRETGEACQEYVRCENTVSQIVASIRV